MVRVARCFGFTLIELMVVIIIIGLMLGLVTTRLDMLSPKSRLQSAGRSIASSIILAHNRAVVMGKPVIVHYHLAKNYHKVILPPAGPEQPAESLSPWELPKGVHFEDIVTASGRKYMPASDIYVEISVTPLGTVMGHVIHLTNERGDKLTLEVNPLTTLVQIKDGYLPMQLIEKQP